jgi:hypothetical protein
MPIVKYSNSISPPMLPPNPVVTTTASGRPSEIVARISTINLPRLHFHLTRNEFNRIPNNVGLDSFSLSNLNSALFVHRHGLEASFLSLFNRAQ